MFAILTIVFAVAIGISFIARKGILALVFCVATIVSCLLAIWLGVKEAAAHWTMFDLYVVLFVPSVYGVATHFKKSRPTVYGGCFVVLAVSGFASTLHHRHDVGLFSFLLSLVAEVFVLLWGLSHLLAKPKAAAQDKQAPEATAKVDPPPRH